MIATPAGEPGNLLLGRWQAVELPPMTFSWDYEFRADGTGTQFHDNGGVLGTFDYVFDGRTLKITGGQGQDPRAAELRFLDRNHFELLEPSFTIGFQRRSEGVSTPMEETTVE